MAALFQELKRRNVFRVTGVYVVVGWLLAQVATTLEEALGLPGWFDGLVVATLLIGLPIAIVLAWAFELTPEGIVRDSERPVEAATPVPVKPIDYAIFLGILALIGLVIGQMLQGGEEPDDMPETVLIEDQSPEPIADATIAVLPFADLSPESDQEYFADGISEEILNVMVKVEGLDVVSRTSSFQFKGAGLGVPEIAERLRVRHVLEGSVRKAGDVLRITAQLIDTENDFHAWSETYDRPLTAENIFVIQDDIAKSIVAALGDIIGVESISQIETSMLTQDVDAYDLFLKARPLFQARENLVQAEGYLKQAVAIDPEFVGAWEMLAAVHHLKFEYGFTGSNENRDAQTMEYINRALALNPDSSAALALRALVSRYSAMEKGTAPDWADNQALLTRATELAPRNTEALNWRGLDLNTLGFLESAMADFQSCIEVDPFYVPCLENSYGVLQQLGRDAEAVAGYQQALMKGATKVYYGPLAAVARRGEILAFIAATNAPEAFSGWRRHSELYLALQNPRPEGYPELAMSLSRFAAADAEVDETLLNSMLIPLGDYSVEPVTFFMWGPSHLEYRRSDVFKQYIRRTGIYDYWREFGFPPQCRPIGESDFSCTD